MSVTARGAELIYGRARDVAGLIRRAPSRHTPSFPASFPLLVYLLGIWGYGQARPEVIRACRQGQAMLRWLWEGCCRAAVSYRCGKHPLDAQIPSHGRKSQPASSIAAVLQVPGHPASGARLVCAGGAGGAHLSVSPPPSPGTYPTWDHTPCILNTGGKRGWGPASPGLVPEEQEVAWGWWGGCWIHPEMQRAGGVLGTNPICLPCSCSTQLTSARPTCAGEPQRGCGSCQGLWRAAGCPRIPPSLSQILPCFQHEEAAGPNRSLEQRVQDLEQRYSEASTLQHIQATLLYDMQAQINNVSVLTDWVWRNPTCLGPADIRLQEEMQRPGDGEMLGWEKRVSILFACSLVSASLLSRGSSEQWNVFCAT